MAGTRLTLERPDDLVRYPSTIKTTSLRPNLLSIEGARDLARVKGYEVFDPGERGPGFWVAPGNGQGGV